MLEHKPQYKFTYSKQCRSCGLKFDTANQLLNHQRKFCMNSGYDSLNGLLQKEIEKKKNFGLTQKNNNTKKNELKKYGQYSLSKLKYQNEVGSQFIRDMTNIHHHKKEIEIHRPYDFNPKTQNSHVSKRAFSTKKFAEDVTYQNSLQKSKYTIKNQLQSYLNPNLSINQTSISPPTNIRKAIDRKVVSVLNRSDASILNMDKEQKKYYADKKLRELKQIKELYVKNGGQSKQFKQSIQKMINFYQTIIDQKPIQSELNLSIASRPQTPINKLQNLNYAKSSLVLIRPSQEKQKINKFSQVKSARIQPEFLNQNPNPNNNQSNPQIIMVPTQNQPFQHDYATMYHLKMMEDMMRLKSDQNNKLIQILSNQLKFNNNNNGGPNHHSGTKGQNSGQKQKDFRFQEAIDVQMPTQDRMMKLLQNQQLDELKMLSKLPIPLQDIKLESMQKAAGTRFQMQKQILKQKLDRLKWQQQVQYFEQMRKLQNDQWTDKQRKRLVQKQMGQYMQDYKQEFTQNQ